LHPSLVTDPNGNQTALAFDALGMVVATAVMGKGGGEGDTLTDPTTRLEYDLLAWQNGQGPAYVHTFAREKHGAANPRWQESYSYSGRLGASGGGEGAGAPAPGPARPRLDRHGGGVVRKQGHPRKKVRAVLLAHARIRGRASDRDAGGDADLALRPAG